MTLIVSFAFCGSIFAQGYESHWNFVNHWEDQGGICAAVGIEGHVFTVNDEGWDALEVAAFVFNEVTGEEELRGAGFFLDRENVDWYDDPYPILPGKAICYTPGDPVYPVYFRMYDHINHIEYGLCEATYQGEPIAILTGDDNMQAWLDEPYDPIILNFTPIKKDIVGYENGGGWYFLTSPVGEVAVADVNNMTINDFDLYYFNQEGDEEGKEWMNYEMGTEEPGFANLELGKGYLYANIADVTLIYPGGLYNGEGIFPLEYSDANEDENMHGWNLMGNPYYTSATVDRAYYRMGENDVLTPCEANTEIEAMEGVLVYADAAGQSVTFTPATESSKGSSLALNLSSDSKVLDRAIIGFGQGSTLPKFQFKNSSKVYIPVDGKDYAIVRSEGMGEMPVSFKAESNGTYSLSLSSENVDFSYLHLIDNLTGTDTDLLANPSYSFDAKTTDYASRFRLVFATGNNDDNFAFFSNGSLVINNEGNATLQVVDVTGRIIKCESINGCANVNINAASGVYMVRLVNGDNIKVQKVVK